MTFLLGFTELSFRIFFFYCFYAVRRTPELPFTSIVNAAYDGVEALWDMLSLMACGWELISMVKVAYKFHMLMILVCELT